MQTRTYNGYTYQRASDGEPWQLVGPAESTPPATIITKRATPYAANAEARAQQDQRLQEQRFQLDVSKDARDASTQPYEARKAAADAAKAEADAAKAERDLTAQQSTATPQQQALMAELANDEVLTAIARARSDINEGGSAGLWARLGDLPGLDDKLAPQGVINLAGSLNTIASRLTLDKLAQLKQLSPMGASGLGSLTEKEGALLRDSVAGLGQTQSPDRLLDNLAAVEKHYRNYMALTKGEDYRDPKVAERYGIAAAPASEPMGLAQGGYRDEPDPALKGVNSHIRGMIGAGKSAGQIVAYMNSVRPGLGTEKAGSVDAAVKFRAQNPTVPLSNYVVSVENRSVPMGGVRETINNIAQTPFGAYMMQAGDAVSAGTLDNFQDNPALTRAGMQAVAADNPTAAIAGMLSGGAITGAVAEGAVARAGANWAPRIADALYGSLYGAGSADEGSRLEGAGWGALGGIAGGELGRRGAAASGRALQGVRGEAQQFLRERGVPMTVGQILGGARKAKEDRLAGFGGVGDDITARRREGLTAFNRAMFDEGIAPVSQAGVGQIGEEGVDTMRGLISGPGGAYDRTLSGVSLVPDQQFGTDVAAALARGGGLARTGPEFTSFVNESIAPHFSAPNGQIDGRQVQDILQQVRGADFGTDAMGGLATDAARDIEGALMNLAERQAPGVMEDLGNANTAYRNLNIIADAVGKGINNDGLVMPSQLGTAARTNTTRFGGRIAAATPDRPFYELQRAGQEVLPSRVPDSGTAGRQEANGGITAVARSIIRNLVNAPLYAEATQPLINRALLDRTPAMIRAGEELEARARIAGLLARPASLAYGPLQVDAPY